MELDSSTDVVAVDVPVLPLLGPLSVLASVMLVFTPVTSVTDDDPVEPVLKLLSVVPSVELDSSPGVVVVDVSAHPLLEPLFLLTSVWIVTWLGCWPVISVTDNPVEPVLAVFCTAYSAARFFTSCSGHG